jgi:ABC-2 type transport system permease protein
MLKYLLEKEFKQIFRNAFLLRMLIIMPLMTIVLFPYVTNQEVRNLKLSVVDHDHSVFSSRLIRKADASAYFQLVSVYPVSSFTSRRRHSSGLSPCSKCPPTPIHLSLFTSFSFTVR